MRKSIGAAAAALLVAGMAFMACGGKSEYELMREGVYRRSNFHAQVNCVQTEVHLRGQKGLEVTEEDRRQIATECIRRVGR
ncbi:MAG: hypothetical protein OXP73_04655 [Chloroflexota bacterium]|nr:hypothetical protein [Chloroflexota bacterium]